MSSRKYSFIKDCSGTESKQAGICANMGSVLCGIDIELFIVRRMVEQHHEI
jgi:hypothetical protein